MCGIDVLELSSQNTTDWYFEICLSTVLGAGSTRAGVSRVGFLRGLSPGLADGCPLGASSPGLPSVHATLVSLPVPGSAFIGTPVRLDEGPP